MSTFEYHHSWNIRNVELAQSLEHYLMQGFEPGGFTTAVLAGDLFNAVAKADHWNKYAIAEIAEAVLKTCPSNAIGSYDAVKAWCNDQDLCRSKYAIWKMLHGPAIKIHNK